MRRSPSLQPNSVVHRERDLRALSRLALLLLCGLLLAGGFVFAAGQHFAAVRYGYQSEGLRRERARLLEEQRRLLLAREEMTSPAHLEAAARGMGLQAVQPAQVNVKKNGQGGLLHPATALGGPSAAFNR